jgi:hypothetical protein
MSTVREQPLEMLLRTVPYTRYHPEWRLLTWHPRGVLDDAVADLVVATIKAEEYSAAVPFHRYTDLNGLTNIQMKVGHLFEITRERTEAREEVKSAFVASTALGFSIARMYETLMTDATICMRAFHERSEAAEWLGVPLEILQPDWQPRG